MLPSSLFLCNTSNNLRHDFFANFPFYSCIPWPGARFSKLAKPFRASIGCYNFLRISKTKTFPGIKLCNKFALSYLEIIVKSQLFRISGSQFLKWLFGPEKFTGLSRNGPLAFEKKRGWGWVTFWYRPHCFSHVNHVVLLTCPNLERFSLKCRKKLSFALVLHTSLSFVSKLAPLSQLCEFKKRSRLSRSASSKAFSRA